MSKQRTRFNFLVVVEDQSKLEYEGTKMSFDSC